MMRDEAISEIGIDGEGRLYVRPESSTFEHIYRTASGVHWNCERAYLFSPIPREWTQRKWFDQIVAQIADEYRIRLRITPDTMCVGMTHELEADIRSVSLP